MERLEIRKIQDAFDEPLEEFVRESGVRLAVLINRSGQVLAQHGFDKVFDLVGVASLAAGHALKDCVLRGSACAAIVVGKVGCAPAMPTPAELDNFLATHPGPTEA